MLLSLVSAALQMLNLWEQISKNDSSRKFKFCSQPTKFYKLVLFILTAPTEH